MYWAAWWCPLCPCGSAHFVLLFLRFTILNTWCTADLLSCLFKPAVKSSLVSFSCQLLYFSVPEFLFGSFELFLLTFSFYSCNIFLTPFSSLSIFPLSSLSIFKTGVLKSLFGIPSVGFFFRNVFLSPTTFFSLWMGHIFLFLLWFFFLVEIFKYLNKPASLPVFAVWLNAEEDLQ